MTQIAQHMHIILSNSKINDKKEFEKFLSVANQWFEDLLNDSSH